MKKNVILFLAIVALCVFACTEKENHEQSEEDTAVAAIIFKPLNLVDAQTKARAQNKLVLIDFYSPT